MAKKYLLVEEDDDSAAGWLVLGVLLAIIYFALSYAHIILATGLGICGIFVAKNICESNPDFDWQQRAIIYVLAILLLGGFGFWGGKEISDHFKETIKSTPKPTRPAKKLNSEPPSVSKPVTSASPELAKPLEKKSEDNSHVELSPPPPISIDDHEIRVEAPLSESKTEDEIPVNPDNDQVEDKEAENP